MGSKKQRVRKFKDGGSPYSAEAPTPSALPEFGTPGAGFVRNNTTGDTAVFQPKPNQGSGAIAGEYIPAPQIYQAPPNAADQATDEYGRILSKFGGSGDAAAIAAGMMAHGLMGRAAEQRSSNIKRESIAQEQQKYDQEHQREQQKLAQEKPLTDAQAEYYRQHGKSEAASNAMKGRIAAGYEQLQTLTPGSPEYERTAAVLHQMQNPQGQQDINQQKADTAALVAAANAEIPGAIEKLNQMYPATTAPEKSWSSFANGGAVNYADGGNVDMPVAIPATHPLAAVIPRYQAYLHAAQQAGVLPVPLAVFSANFQAAQQQPAASNPQGTMMADGGDVSALQRPLQGPGTGRSDSIPAVIDGSKPAALSSGEFVIPEYVVRRLGTKFFENLLEQNHPATLAAAKESAAKGASNGR